MSYAYMGRILRVDLSARTVREETLAEDVYRRVLGGMGLASWLLLREIPRGIDALGPENILAFVPGLLTGTGSLFTGRWMALAKSPLTLTIGDANCGGSFAPAIKQCGWDGIFISGASKEPLYLYSDGRTTELRDASELWGMDAVECEKRLWEDGGAKRRPSVVCIGQAGEKLSLISGIVHDGGRLAARSGLGAVMGSKGLKAITLCGSRPVSVADPGQMRSISSRLWKTLKPSFPLPPGGAVKFLGVLLRALPFGFPMDGLIFIQLLKKWGTSAMNQAAVEMGDAPIKNWAGSEKDFVFKLSNSLNPDFIISEQSRKYHCYSCPIGCGGHCKMPDGSGNTHKPEYETVLALSGLLMCNDLGKVFEMNELLNRAGMDSISAGGTLAFAMECFEKGVLSLEDTGGIDLSWGRADSALELLKLMIERRGIGEVFADGSKRAAERLGRGSADYAIHSGGQELAMHDPRNDPGYGLHAAVDPSPGRHTVGSQLYYEMWRLWKKLPAAPRPPLLYGKASKYVKEEEKGVAAAYSSRYVALFNALGLCLFGSFCGADRLGIFEAINAATGWNLSPQEAMEAGRLIQSLRQEFNLREGLPSMTDKIARRAIGLPQMLRGANRGRSFDIKKMEAAYRRALGWDVLSGAPDMALFDGLGIPARQGGF